MYNLCPKPEILLNVKSNLNMLVNTPQINEWWWIDAIQMGMPGFAKMGKLTGEQKYFKALLSSCIAKLMICSLPEHTQIQAEGDGVGLLSLNPARLTSNATTERCQGEVNQSWTGKS